MNPIIGATIGLGLGAGILLFIVGLQRQQQPLHAVVRSHETLAQRWERLTRRPAGKAGRRRDLWWLLTAALTVVGFVVTGLPVVLLAVPMVTLLVPWLLSNPNVEGIRVTAAIDQWVRSLRSVLLSGSDNTLEGAIQSSLPTAPDAIREPLRLLVARIGSRWPTERALAYLAEELADPTADVVVAALILAAKRRGTGLSDVLDGLAVAVADEVRARRKIESERASTRAAARYLALIFAAMAVGLGLMNPVYLEPYKSGLGQLVLLVAIGGFLASLYLLRRISTAKSQPRLWPGVGSAARELRRTEVTENV